MPLSGYTSIGDRRRDLVVVLVFLVLVVAPGVAFALGARPENRENRSPAGLPAISLSAMADPSFFSALDRFLADRFPLRSDAAEIDAGVRYFVFRTSPNRDVVVGDDIWLFSRDALEPRCVEDAGAIVAAADHLTAAFGSMDIDFHLVIVPDKQAIYPELRPARFEPCSDRVRGVLRSRLPVQAPAVIDLWGPLQEAAGDKQRLLFWPRDTHWSPSGALIGIHELVEAVDESTWDSESVIRDGYVERDGDLSTLMGIPMTDSLPGVHIENGNDVTRKVLETPVDTRRGRDLQQFNVTGDAPTIPGSTLLVHDSAFGVYAPIVSPWFEQSTWLHINELIEHPEIVRDLPQFDRVIVERVERFSYGRSFEEVLLPVVEAAQKRAHGPDSD